MIARYRRPAAARLVSAAEIAGVRAIVDDDEVVGRDPLLAVRDIDSVEWIEGNIYLAPAAELIRLRLYQKLITRFVFTRRADGRFPFQTIVYSQPKKGGKTTLVGAWERWLAETQVRYGNLFCIGNDEDQAKARQFAVIAQSIELTPGYERSRERLPGRWTVQRTAMQCLTSNSTIKAIAVDPEGEAGGWPYCTVWTELWGYETEQERKFWTEMTPVPTVPDSMRIVDTYAGFEGGSELLWELYTRGKSGLQLTAGEMARVAARDKDGERYEDFLHAFVETGGNPDAPVPCWTDGRMFMFWDSGWEAHRNTGEQTAEYYEEEEKTNPPQQFQRIHLNLWVSDVSNAIPIEWWNACYDEGLPPLGLDEPMILGLDAGARSDNFAAVAVTRDPRNPLHAAVRAVKVWRPEDFPDHLVDFEQVWQWVANVCRTHRVVQVAYDPHQLEDMSQRIRRELEVWAEPVNQAKERKIGDRRFYNAVRDRTVVWNLHDEAGAMAFRQHIGNANSKHQKDQDSTMLFIKKSEGRKIDLLVAASMAHERCLALFMEAA
jgi:phage terminase large subunit-like protein